MKKKVLIIGKKSFIGSNLHNFFKKKNINSKIISFETFLINNINIKEFNYIINCTTNKNLIKKNTIKNSITT